MNGYEGLYQVSNLDRVKSLERQATPGKGNGYRKELIMKPSLLGNGYATVTLTKNKSPNYYRVHRLVAEAFIQNPDNLPLVNYKDENKLNNQINNLEWCTYKYNDNYGTRNKQINETHINRKISCKSVVCIETGIIYDSIKEADKDSIEYIDLKNSRSVDTVEKPVKKSWYM